MEPLVSVILLCHNQAPFVAEAFRSVCDQDYPGIQLIVVDDASSDGSREVIKNLIKKVDGLTFIELKKRVGNCAAFNVGLEKASGKYIIDLAADDILLPARVSRQVDFFETLGEDYGVIYSNAKYVDKQGVFIKDHFSHQAIPPQGDVYEKLISTYFIPPPTMMMRRKVLNELHGYDSNLAYEDFDFWVRSARNYRYAYQPLVLTAIRKVDGSLSSRLYQQNDRQLYSTYLVCLKIKDMNQTPAEDKALIRRLKYEIRHSVFTANFYESELMIALLKKLTPLTFVYQVLAHVSRLKINLTAVRRMYVFLTKKLLPPKTHFH